MLVRFCKSFVIPWMILVSISFGLVYALSSATGRILDVEDLSGWLDESQFLRYALSMGLAFTLHSLAIHSGLISRQETFHHRTSFHQDGLRGYRIAVAWLVCLSLTHLLRQGPFVVHWGWFAEGALSLLSMALVISVEHYFWRGWGLNELKRLQGQFWPSGIEVKSWIPVFTVTVGWAMQRVIFFGVTQPRLIQALVLESAMSVLLTKILGFTGAWVFLALWMSVLHGVLGLPFMGLEMNGLLFVQFNPQHEVVMNPMDSLIWWGLFPLALALMLSWTAQQLSRKVIARR